MKYIPLLAAIVIALTLPALPAPQPKPCQALTPDMQSVEIPTLPELPTVPVYYIIERTAEPPQPVTVAQEPQAYYPITAWERALICRVMMSECAGEPPEGQRAVAQVILDRLQSDDFPGTVYEVLTQSGQFAAPSEADVNAEIAGAVAAVFDRGERVSEELLYYFYAPRYGWSGFHEAQTFTIEIGHHKFYK